MKNGSGLVLFALGILGLVLFANAKPPPLPKPKALLLFWRVGSDAAAEQALRVLNSLGEVSEMRDFDGSKMQVVWVPAKKEAIDELTKRIPRGSVLDKWVEL